MIEKCIAIDGPSSSGKSTIAKMLAQKLKGYYHLNTGNLYRAAALHCKRNSIDIYNEQEVINGLSNLKLEVTFMANGEQNTLLDKEVVDKYLHTEEISKIAAIISTYKGVRMPIYTLQRAFAIKHDMIMEGRDITSEILPESRNKFYICASAEARAKWRFDEYTKKGQIVNYEDIKQSLIERDRKDMNREFGALKITDDAIVIDTSEMTLEGVVEQILANLK